MAPRKWRVAEEEEKEKLKSELAAWVTRSVARRGASVNSVAKLQKTELPKAKKAKKVEKDVELKVVEDEEVKEGMKTIVIEFFFRFSVFFFFFFFSLGTLSLFGYGEKWNRKLVSWYGFLAIFVWKVRFFTS